MAKKTARRASKTAPPSAPRFSKKTIDFLLEAGAATKTDWLDNHAVDHKTYLIEPLQKLALKLSAGLSGEPDARGFRFPARGFGRLRRPKHKVGRGQPAFRNWVHLTASKPSASIFDENPTLYLYISPDEIFSAGGLYMPSSRQVKQLRAYIANDASAFDRLFKTKAFKAEFPQGFQTEKKVKTFPRHYPQDHKRIEWLKLQAYYVTRRYSKKEFYSADFADLVLENWRQALRFDAILYDALEADIELPFAPAREVDDEAEEVSKADLWDERL